MIKIIKIIGILLLLTTFQIVNGQTTDKQKAIEKGKEAVRLMDNGRYEESIKLLKEAQQLDPKSFIYPYELAYAFYMQKDYKKAKKYVESSLKYKDVNENAYQLLGNTYDYLGKSEKAIKTYEKGLKLFPNSGNLYLELGVMQMKNKEYLNALQYFEKGIEVEPNFPSNYYWAAKIFLSSSEEVWGMIYGEIFINLEPTTKRSTEIGKLLYKTYKNEIKVISDTSYSVSFSKNTTININNLEDLNNLKPPYGVTIYEPTLMFSIIGQKVIDINTLITIRSKFVDNYFSNGHDKQYPNLLFSYQKQIKDAGHFEAYTYFVLGKGDDDTFQKWLSENEEKWQIFIDWFVNNKININESNKFYRGKY
ncbi:MAG: hypothetical protein CVU04_05565 [Bacteroidetes bacterium HGW-Bacteroidetes-20]|nr:MAG: hypothetical protein CVU04_05565 [Bacteroidetes bacterium HGW-Bacteroidetes-20]